MQSNHHVLTSQTREHGHHGFTLIEILAVISIIGVLMSLMIGSARFARLKAMEGRAKSDMQHLANALNEYQLKYRQFPEDLTNLSSLLPANVSPTNDPWHRKYIYDTPTDRLSYTLRSDGRTTNALTSDDIILGK